MVQLDARLTEIDLATARRELTLFGYHVVDGYFSEVRPLFRNAAIAAKRK